MTATIDDLNNDDSTMYVTTSGNNFTVRGMVDCWQHRTPQEDA